MGTALTGSAAGSFFHRLGEIEGAWLDWISLFGAAATANVASGAQVPTRLAAFVTDLTAGNADYQVITLVQQALSSFQGTPANVGGSVQQAVQQLFVNMANLDMPLPSLTVQAALTLLFDEMQAAVATVSQGTLPAVGAQTAAAWVTPVGNPVFAFSAVDAAGRALQYVYPETLAATITQDAQNGATAGQEPYSFAGQNANNSPFSFDWLTSKYGSGASAQGQLVDPSQSYAGGGSNLTVNGAFASFSNTDYADNFVYVVGVATTNFKNSTATTAYYAGGGSLEMLSDGTNKNDVRQKFNTASSTGAGTGGSPYAFVPSAANNAQWLWLFAYKLTNASPTAGTLTFDVCDNNGTTVNDDQGTANSVSINLTSIADTNWHTGALPIRMPKMLPAALPIQTRARFTGTILDSGKGVYLGAWGLALMTQFYVGGPYLAGFRGSTNPNASGAYPDSWTFAVTATVGKLQKAMWRWFNPPSFGSQTPGLVVPAVASGSATIPDSLVA